jgi:hypothetical protein
MTFVASERWKQTMSLSDKACCPLAPFDPIKRPCAKKIFYGMAVWLGGLSSRMRAGDVPYEFVGEKRAKEIAGLVETVVVSTSTKENC